jgi:hypothetical protein
MVVTLPHTLVLFRPNLRGQDGGKFWHLSYRMNIAGPCRSACGLTSYCEMLSCQYHLIDIEELRTNKSVRKMCCIRCLKMVGAN